ncbi:hypothetical protein [Roseobacter ponti]|uniref:Uncharacterized protein n=1 Tax=Roseobacter ponti TaxID=1891787 RepID=A0A858SVH4_9RHOB|nr:hypothetical protein [Roseobacter ponti]QJF52969.1 hypothetical protein G3256_18200 [Roseobacter ponti]
MDLIADIFLGAAAMGAGIYCLILGRRLNRFNDLEKGVGGAVAVLSAQVDDLTKTLAAAQSTASHSAETLTELTRKAESMAQRLELQMASMHDIPEPPRSNGSVVAHAPAAPQTPAEPMFVRHRGTAAQ